MGLWLHTMNWVLNKNKIEIHRFAMASGSTNSIGNEMEMGRRRTAAIEAWKRQSSSGGVVVVVVVAAHKTMTPALVDAIDAINAKTNCLRNK